MYLFLSLSLSLSLYLSSLLYFWWSGHVFSISFARLGCGVEGRKALNSTQSVSKSVNNQGRPRAAGAAKNFFLLLP